MLIHAQNPTFSPNFPFPTIPHKHSLIFPSKFPAVNKIFDLDSKFRSRARCSCVLAGEQVELSSKNGGKSFLEREFGFSPSFNEYVKVMESVKVDRVREDLDGKRSRNLRRDIDSDREGSYGVRKSVSGENSDSRGGRVVKEGILDNESVGRGRSNVRGVKEGILDNESVGRGRSNVRGVKEGNLSNVSVGRGGASRTGELEDGERSRLVSAAKTRNLRRDWGSDSECWYDGRGSVSRENFESRGGRIDESVVKEGILDNGSVRRGGASRRGELVEDGGNRRLVGAKRTVYLRRDRGSDGERGYNVEISGSRGSFVCQGSRIEVRPVKGLEGVKEHTDCSDRDHGYNVERSGSEGSFISQGSGTEVRHLKGLEEGIVDNETVGRGRANRIGELGKGVRNGVQKSERNYRLNREVCTNVEDDAYERFLDGRVANNDSKKIMQSKQLKVAGDGTVKGNVDKGERRNERTVIDGKASDIGYEPPVGTFRTSSEVGFKNKKFVQLKQLKTTRDDEAGIFNSNKNKGEKQGYRKVGNVESSGICYEPRVRTFQHTSEVAHGKFARSNSVSKRGETNTLIGENCEGEISGSLDDQFYSRHVEKKTAQRKNENFSGRGVSVAIQRNSFDRSSSSRSNGYSSTDTNTWDYGRKMSKNNNNLGPVSMKDNATKTGFTKHDKSSWGTTESYDLNDRAAFKTFEVFTDVRNRPRVLRMELEEKIKKLAKQLHAADINMPEWQFSKMIHDAKIKFTDHSILRVVQMLGTFGNWNRVLQVVEWLQKTERFKSYKSRYMYTTALDVLGKAKRPVEALNLFYAMRQELSSYPDLAAYHCIAVTLGQAGFMKELFDVIDCMRAVPEKNFNLGPLQKWDPRLEPDLVVYNAVLNACVQQKKWEGAFWVLQQLKEQGIKPSNTTHGLVMEVMLACEKYNLVYEFFSKVEKSSIPGVLNYKVLVNALWKEGKIDEAVLAVEDMERRGVVGSASLYYDLARCLCSAGRCQEALMQISKICKVAKKPLVVTYTGLIQACLDSGSIENAAFLFNEMQKYCLPNVITCNIMIKSYIEHGLYMEANDLFLKILDDCRQIMNRDDMNQKVLPDKFTFNTMIEASAKLQKWDDFENAYRQMLKHGYHFDTKRHLRMVLDAFRAGKVQVLELTWKHLSRYGRVPPSPIIKERFCSKLMKDDHIAAVSSISVHDIVDIHAFSEKSWLDLLYSNSSHFKNFTLSKLADELKHLLAEKNEPDPVCQNLAYACNHFLASRHNISDLPKELSVSLSNT